jgi:hypothetical protein
MNLNISSTRTKGFCQASLNYSYGASMRRNRIGSWSWSGCTKNLNQVQKRSALLETNSALSQDTKEHLLVGFGKHHSQGCGRDEKRLKEMTLNERKDR